MQKCLNDICVGFESCSNFLNDKTKEKSDTVEKLFSDFMECFSALKEQKLEYPSEFVSDVRYYVEGNEAVLNKFKDVEMKYLMLSDFYDFCRLTKKYKVAN
jgi:hypothetical protein